MTINQAYKNIKADLERYYLMEAGIQNPSSGMKLYILCFAFGFHATMVYRIGSYFYNIKTNVIIKSIFTMLYKFLKVIVEKMYGIHISDRATIGKGLYIGHFGDLYIENCKIGDSCSVHALSHIKNGVIIGNNVWIGGLSILEENIVIGDGVTISSGTNLSKNIKSGALVSGNPGRVIRASFDNSSMLATA